MKRFALSLSENLRLLAAGSVFLFSTISSADTFTVKFKDKTNLEWSQDVGRHTNGCVDVEKASRGEYDVLRSDPGGLFDRGAFHREKCTVHWDSGTVVDSDSAAASACKQIGGRLPTQTEYEGLIRSFDSLELPKVAWYYKSRGPALTRKGLAQFLSIFDDHSLNTEGSFDKLQGRSISTNDYWTSSIYYSHGLRIVPQANERAALSFQVRAGIDMIAEGGIVNFLAPDSTLKGVSRTEIGSLLTMDWRFHPKNVRCVR